MPKDRTILDAAISRACLRGSYYWAFLAKRGKARRREYLVEARIDLPSEAFDGLNPPMGWSVDDVQPERGMVFMRRLQPLRDKDLREMVSTLLTFASERGGRFHSWMHDDPDGQYLDGLKGCLRKV